MSYANALGNPFVLDDTDGILQNTHIRQLTPLREVLTAPPQSVVAGRPVVGVSLALNYAWGELTPFGYHLVNLVVLWATALLIFGIVRRTLRLPSMGPEFADVADGVALTVAAVWMVHPLQTELVNYVVQRSESMMGGLYLLTIYASLRAMTDRRAVLWTIAAVAASLLGMATKESMATAPLMVLLFDAVFVSGSLKESLRSRPGLYGGLAASWALLLYLNAGGPRARSAGFSSGVSAWTYLLNQGPLIVNYLKLVIWPHPLIADYGVTRDIALGAALPGVVVVGLLGVAALFAFWKWPKAGFLAMWFFVTLAPASSIVPIATEVGAERRMYLPLVAVVTLIVCGATWWVRRNGRQVRVAGAIAAVVVLALAIVTIRRNTDYADQTALWQQVIRDRPNGRAHYSLAMTLRDRGDRSAAIAEFQKAIAEGQFEGYYAVGFAYDEMNRTDEAIEQYKFFIAHAGEDYRVPLAWALLGRALARQQKYAEAEAAFRKTLTMQPRNKEARGGLADVMLSQERYAEAVDAYRVYLEVAPAETAAAYGNLGRALVGANRNEEAVGAFERAVAQAPNDPMARMNYGLSLASVGKLDEAVAQYRAGLNLAPNQVLLLSALGSALAAQGKGHEAAAAFDRALQIDPGNPTVRADIEAALRK